MCSVGPCLRGEHLAYNPARDEAEWVLARSVANNLSWAEEKSAMALANYVPCISEEGAHIARLGTRCLMSWADDYSLQEEEDDEQEEEEEHEEVEEQGEVGPKPPSGGAELKQGETEQEAEPCR